MRPFLLLLLCLLALPGWSLGRLIQPDGSMVALGEQISDAATTFLFPAHAVPLRSWVLLPPATVASEVEVMSPGGRRVVAFPAVRIPGLRFALEVPAHTLSLTVRGRLTGTDLIRSPVPPPRDGQPWVVRSSSELRVDVPTWKVAEGWTPYLRLTRPIPSPWSVVVVSSSGSRTFTLAASVRQWDYAPTAWGMAPTSVIVRGADPRLSELKMVTVAADHPLPVDPSTLLAWPQARWRSDQREWFHWSGTSVLVLVTKDYQTQDDYLKRLAFFVEKAGYRGKIVEPDEIAHLHAWNAHDYAAPDLARFFTQAAADRRSLNPAERELREQLVASGILVPGNERWEAGAGALVGVSAESPDSLRATLFVHEAFHGLYFTTPGFRDGVRQAWDGLSEPARQAFRAYLFRSRYDPTDEGLMVNEFQAYVLQRPARDWEGFFRDRVLGSTSLATRLSLLGEYLSAAEALDRLVTTLFGLASGEVSPVTASSGT